MIDLRCIEGTSEDAAGVGDQLISDRDGTGDGAMVVNLSHHVEFLLLGRVSLHLAICVNIVGVVMLRSVAASLRPTCLTP